MKQIIATLAIITSLYSTPTLAATNETEIPITFSASQFNDTASKYMQRPTFATLNTKSNGKSWLDLTMDQYGNHASTNSFSFEHCDEYIALVDKYLEWEETASKDGDIIDKKIGKAKNVNFGLTFFFYSANPKNHFLTIGYSKEYSQYFTREAAIELKNLFTRYKNNELKPLDKDKKYQ